MRCLLLGWVGGTARPPPNASAVTPHFFFNLCPLLDLEGGARFKIQTVNSTILRGQYRNIGSAVGGWLWAAFNFETSNKTHVLFSQNKTLQKPPPPILSPCLPPSLPPSLDMLIAGFTKMTGKPFSQEPTN